MSMNAPRPRFEDVPEDVTARHAVYESRLNRWEFRTFREEVNGDLRWLALARSWVVQVGRILIVALPVVLGAIIALHISAQL